MFLVNQSGDTAINLDTVDMLIAAKAKRDDKDKHPLVVAVMGEHEEPIGRYNALAECKLAIDVIAWEINCRKPNIQAPTHEAIVKYNTKRAAEKANHEAELVSGMEVQHENTSHS